MQRSNVACVGWEWLAPSAACEQVVAARADSQSPTASYRRVQDVSTYELLCFQLLTPGSQLLLLLPPTLLRSGLEDLAEAGDLEGRRRRGERCGR